MKTVFIDAGQFITDEAMIAPLKERGEVVVFSGVPQDINEAADRAKGAEAVAFGIMQISNELLDRLPKLRVLQFIGTGVTSFVDMEYAASKGISVLNLEGYGNNAVAEFGITMALAAARQVSLGNALVRSGEWVNAECEGLEIAGSKFGVVGTGNIGALVAEKASRLGAEVYCFDLFENEELKEAYGVKYVSLEEMFRTCNIVSLHLKINDKTAGIVSRKLIDSMPERSVLVNVARSALVDEDALYDALKSKRLLAAAIDVYEEEPPKNCRFTELDNVILTPHIGYYTKKASDNSIAMAVRSIAEALQA
ncbi:MAG: hypothetical protein LBL54_05845 [Clostridiales Family XIII bacterium]|jgi:phosphoglycerate dehydrogenase-like enzyme|nr:hypothetical protein [Clostridiales Family XIII bacterium]